MPRNGGKGRAPRALPQAPRAQMPVAVAATSSYGYFANAAGKNLTIMPNQPLEGWTVLSFTDMGDDLHLTDQVMYVPTEQFNRAIDAYRGTVEISRA